MSGCGKPKRKFRLNYQRIYAPQTAQIGVKWIKFDLGKVSVKLSLSLCAVGALLVLSAFAWANSLSSNPAQPSVHAFSYSLGDQAQTLGIEPEFGAIDPADLSATTEDYEDGIYDWFADQIETLLAPIGPVDPASDRMSWAILLIAFAGMTAAASGGAGRAERRCRFKEVGECLTGIGTPNPEAAWMSPFRRRNLEFRVAAPREGRAARPPR